MERILAVLKTLGDRLWDHRYVIAYVAAGCIMAYALYNIHQLFLNQRASEIARAKALCGSRRDLNHLLVDVRNLVAPKGAHVSPGAQAFVRRINEFVRHTPNCSNIGR